MSSADENERQPRFLGRGALTSLFIHLGILFPFTVLAFFLASREEARRPDEVEMTFKEVDPAELPDDLPEIEPEPAPRERERLAQAVEPEPEVKPEEPPPPPEEAPQEPPPPKPEPRANQKSVDFEIDKEEEPSPNARFLAEKSNRVEEETRADRTNLEKEQKGENSSSPSDRQDTDEGDPDDKVARLEDQKSKLGRRAPDVTPHQEQSLQPSPSPSRKSLLSMRETAPRQHEISPETFDPALPRDPNGVIAMPDERLESMKDLPGQSGAAPRTSLRLSSKQYEYLFGDDADAATRFATTERSRKQGRFAKRQAQIQAALENFIPEVRPGNQTALNTRAAPFAAFIARMHRNIHEGWGFGFLEELAGKSLSDPMNNPNLMAKLEIVLNGDGTVDKVTVVRASGLLGYDVAAIDTVYNAAPFPDPPRAIRSRNGKIYVHWSFHRDERQCATSGVDYYILDNPPAGGDLGEDAASAPPLPPPPPPAFPGGPPAAGRARAQGAGDGEGSGAAEERRLRRLSRGEGEGAPPRAGGRYPGGSGEGEGGEEGPAGHGPGDGHGHGGPVGARPPGTQPPESDHAASRRAAQQIARADDPAARDAADRWWEAFVRRDVKALVSAAALPFLSREGVAARSAGELGGLLHDLLPEFSGSPKLQGLQLYSAAGVRGLLGGIPAALGDGGGLLFAVARTSEGPLVLVLSRQKSGWRPSGLIRI